MIEAAWGHGRISYLSYSDYYDGSTFVVISMPFDEDSGSCDGEDDHVLSARKSDYSSELVAVANHQSKNWKTYAQYVHDDSGPSFENEGNSLVLKF